MNPAAARFEGELECVPPESECPAVDEVRVEIGDCDRVDGTRRVTFEITTNAAAVAAATVGVLVAILVPAAIACDDE